MGTRKIQSGGRSASLSLEPLEDRFLLSGVAVSGATPLAAPVPHNQTAGSQSTPAPLSPWNESSAHVTMPGLLASTGTASHAQEPAGHVGPDAPAVAPGPAAATPASTPDSMPSEKATQKVPYLIPASRATYEDARGMDRDDDSPAMEYSEVHLHSLPASLDTSLSASAVIAGPREGDSARSGATAAQAASPHTALDLFSAAGLGSAGLARVAAVLPASAAALEMWWGHGPSPQDRPRETVPPPASPSQPLELPPPIVMPDTPVPASPPGDPFADLLPLDAAALQRSADTFFAQLAGLSEVWSDGPAIDRLVPWAMAAGVAAYEWLRWRRMRSAATSEDNRGPEPAAFLAGDEA